MIHQFANKSYLINLSHRSDRLVKFTEQATQIGLLFERFEALYARHIPIDYFVFSANNKRKEFTPGAYALVKTTEQIIKKAKSEGWESVLIMEDDICFAKKLQPDFIEQAIQHIPNNWQVLLLAEFTAIAPKNIQNHYWKQTVLSYSCACYVVRQSFFDKYLHFLESPKMPIDDFLTLSTQKQGTCYSLSHSIAYQTTDHSDITNNIRHWKTDKHLKNGLI